MSIASTLGRRQPSSAEADGGCFFPLDAYTGYVVDVSFSVLGDPVPDKRPRFNRRTGRTYPQDERTKRWKAAIRAALLETTNGVVPKIEPGQPSKLFLLARIRRPKAHFVAGDPARDLKKSSPILHTSTPDRDNLEKLVLDAFGTRKDPFVWADDGGCCCGRTLKIYSNGEPGLDIRLTTIQQMTLIDEDSLDTPERLEVFRRRFGKTHSEMMEALGLTRREYADLRKGVSGYVIPETGRLREYEQCYLFRRRSGYTLAQMASESPFTAALIQRVESAQTDASPLFEWYRNN